METQPGRPFGSSASEGSASLSVRQAKILIFTAAFLSFLLSVFLFFSGDRERGIFVGIWVPSILSAGNLLMTGEKHD